MTRLTPDQCRELSRYCRTRAKEAGQSPKRISLHLSMLEEELAKGSPKGWVLVHEPRPET
jgi:hypothetical protein